MLYAKLVLVKHLDDLHAPFHVTEKWQMLVFWGVLIVVGLPLLIVFHELLHVIVLPHKLKNVTVVFDLPRTVSVGGSEWLTKTEELILLAGPVTLISLLLVLPLCLFGHWVMGGLLMIVNVGMASSDLFAFFYLLFRLPKDTVILGNRYKTNS
jgi:hypothetical protein